ncbi:MAG: hypothetical protein ACO3A2_08430 [Bdellovibrionia bacterium]
MLAAQRLKNFFSILLLSSPLLAQEPIELPRIIRSSSRSQTPAELLLEDPIMPKIRAQTSLPSANGSIENSISNHLALPTTDYGQPGQLTQFRGIGGSAQETDVQALGISLNPPGGGGFDLSIFPPFLWSEFQFQLGPSLNAQNQSASSGTLTLRPWTAQAIGSPPSTTPTRITHSSMSRGAHQLSVGHRPTDQSALIFGTSLGAARGPSGSSSLRWEKGNYTGEFHLLFTDLALDSKGSTDQPTPEAQIRNTRALPLIENDFHLGRDRILKTSLFYDWSYLGYRDPQLNVQSDTYAQQWGSQLTYVSGDWKWGTSLRQVNFASPTNGFQAPLQSISTFQVSKETEAGSLLILPVIQSLWINGYGLMPQGSLGIRKQWENSGFSLYSRTQFSRSIPSLMDRFGNYGTFVGNPELKTENDWTQLIGAQLEKKDFEFSVSGYGQLRKNPRVRLGSTLSNLNDATVLGLLSTFSLRFAQVFELRNSLTLTHSHIQANSAAFPYLPSLANSLSFTARGEIQPNFYTYFKKIPIELSVFLKAATSRKTAIQTPQELPGYWMTDLAFKLQFNKSYDVFFRVENIFNHPIELIQGYPIQRSLSLALTAEL